VREPLGDQVARNRVYTKHRLDCLLAEHPNRASANHDNGPGFEVLNKIYYVNAVREWFGKARCLCGDARRPAEQ
jgi:hypothetical protein